MSNYHLKDRKLSLRAKGMLSLMYSLPDDWDYSLNGLNSICNESKSVLRNVLMEMEDNKYLIRTRTQNDKGQFEYIYDIYEKPYIENPCAETPCMEKPHAVKPYTENDTQYNTNILNTNNQILKEESTDEEKDIFSFIENNFSRTLSPIEYELINKWKEFYNDDVIKYAVEKACLNNAKTIKYVDGILKSWKSKGFTHLVDCKGETINTSDLKDGVIIPDWFNNEPVEHIASAEEQEEFINRLKSI